MKMDVDTRCRPQDDLFRYVNGKWLERTEIAPDRATAGSFLELRDKSENDVRAIVEELAATHSAPGSISQLIGDLYRSFMNESSIEARGVSPIRPYIDEALAIINLSDFEQVMGRHESLGMSGLFYSFVGTDATSSKEHILYIGQSGLSLPNESYYREEQYQSHREALVRHIAHSFDLVGIDDSEEHAQRILALECAIASFHWDTVRSRDIDLTYNKFTFDELQALTPALAWENWMFHAEIPPSAFSKLVVRQPSFFEGISGLLSEFDRNAWSSWLAWRVISSRAPYLNKAMVDASFDFYGRRLMGVPENRERWKRGIGLVDGVLGEAIGEIYVSRHFPPGAKARMEELVANLIAAYRIDITNLDWMSSTTIGRALEKLEKFAPRIGYPNKWRNYDGLAILGDDLEANLVSISRYEQNYELAKLSQPVDPEEWFTTPQTVNAYYHPVRNEIVFPAAILQPPFFDFNADDAVNYGAIGAIIGHEIGHGFDDQGSKFDGDGNLNNWWTDSDRIEFDKRSAMLIEQYNSLRPEEAPELTVNGALTIGENIGDLGGLTIAYKAYEISLAGAPAPIIEGLTGFQRLFLSWARAWRGKVRPEEVRRRIVVDPHSPPEFRCNQVVRNLDEFYQAFEVTEDDALFLPENQRVRIW